MKLRLLRPHPYATWVDAGRFNFRDRGVPWSGAIDDLSFSIAQRAVGNPESTVALEIRALGFEAIVVEPGTLCWVGAHAEVQCNDQILPSQYRANLKAGDALKFGIFEMGSTMYLTTPGGWTVPIYAGSACGPCRETTLSSANHNVALRLGALQCDPLEDWAQPLGIPIRAWPLNGAEFHDIIGARSLMTVDPSSNRLGVRLNGECSLHTLEIASQPTMPGMVQWTPSGQLIIIGVDGPTMGGYPIVGYVPKHALYRVGQLKAGDIVEWVIDSPDFELAINSHRNQCLNSAELSALTT